MACGNYRDWLLQASSSLFHYPGAPALNFLTLRIGTTHLNTVKSYASMKCPCIYIYAYSSLFGKLLLLSFICFSTGKHANRKITEFVFLTPSKFTFDLIYNNEISNQLFALLTFYQNP